MKNNQTLRKFVKQLSPREIGSLLDIIEKHLQNNLRIRHQVFSFKKKEMQSILVENKPNLKQKEIQVKGEYAIWGGSWNYPELEEWVKFEGIKKGNRQLNKM